jgi:hypothetical protein
MGRLKSESRTSEKYPTLTTPTIDSRWNHRAAQRGYKAHTYSLAGGLSGSEASVFVGKFKPSRLVNSGANNPAGKLPL